MRAVAEPHFDKTNIQEYSVSFLIQLYTYLFHMPDWSYAAYNFIYMACLCLCMYVCVRMWCVHMLFDRLYAGRAAWSTSYTDFDSMETPPSWTTNCWIQNSDGANQSLIVVKCFDFFFASRSFDFAAEEHVIVSLHMPSVCEIRKWCHVVHHTQFSNNRKRKMYILIQYDM